MIEIDGVAGGSCGGGIAGDGEIGSGLAGDGGVGGVSGICGVSVGPESK